MSLAKLMLELLRSELAVKLASAKIPIENCLNWDESGINPMAQAKFGFRDGKTPFKLLMERLRFTFQPVISPTNKVQYPPAIISKSKGFAWTDVKDRTTRTVTFGQVMRNKLLNKLT